jgi:hypothetical protein
MVKVAATPSSYDRGAGIGMGGGSRWRTTACTKIWSLSQATTRRIVPSSS